jgi:hypothetical protein
MIDEKKRGCLYDDSLHKVKIILKEILYLSLAILIASGNNSIAFLICGSIV